MLYEILEGLLCTFIPLSLSMIFFENIADLLPISYLAFFGIGNNFPYWQVTSYYSEHRIVPIGYEALQGKIPPDPPLKKGGTIRKGY